MGRGLIFSRLGGVVYGWAQARNLLFRGLIFNPGRIDLFSIFFETWTLGVFFENAWGMLVLKTFGVEIFPKSNSFVFAWNARQNKDL